MRETSLGVAALVSIYERPTPDGDSGSRLACVDAGGMLVVATGAGRRLDLDFPTHWQVAGVGLVTVLWIRLKLR